MVADIEVLAEDAAQVAAGKEYSAGTTRTDEYAFLAEVRADRADDRHISGAAKAYLAVGATDSALARTEDAGIHKAPELPSSVT